MNIKEKYEKKNYGSKMKNIYFSVFILMVLFAMTANTADSKSVNTSVVGQGTLHTLSNSDPSLSVNDARTFNVIANQIRLKGDINEDGNITVADALLYLRYSVGQNISPYHIDISDDVTCDGKITVADALMVLRKSVGQNVNLQCSPTIIGFAPSSPVDDNVGAIRTFNVTVDQTINITWYINGTNVFNQSGVTESSYTNNSATQGIWIVNATATNANGTISNEWTWNVSQGPSLPPDPITVAPPVDTSVATDIASSTEFLYTGNNSIQTGVANGTIDAKRVTVLRGRVLSREGANLSGVNISVPTHPEFGYTTSRADGMFDMAVNGGGYLNVNYEKKGYLTVQRQVNVPWRDYVWLPDVMMIQADSTVTAVNLSSNASQVARGSMINDSDGTRQATLLFPQGTQVNITLPNGTNQSLTNMHVRATEYTVGQNGSKAMPAELPPSSGYTYAVEYNVDENIGNSEIYFARPVYTYVENFLNFSAGSLVPVGYYNRSLSQWIPSNNGIVIKILSITGGMVDLDVDGSGQNANTTALASLNITDTERQQLATLYQIGQSLWRVPIDHFTQPWDFNWPFGLPPGATGPPPPPPQPPLPITCNQKGGSIIGCQNQELSEDVDIVAGTPLSMHYQSGNVPGHIDDYTLSITLSGANISSKLKRIDLEISVSGRLFTQSFPNIANQTYNFTWDGKDAYGRRVLGKQLISVRIGNVYDGVYLQPSEYPGNGYDKIFDHFSYYGTPATGNFTRQEVTLWQKWRDSIGGLNVRDQGGWNLNVHHTYDPIGKILYLGDGERRTESAVGNVINTVAGNLFVAFGVAVGPDGSIYIVEYGTNRIRKVGTDGNITTVAGNGRPVYSGDGGPAILAGLGYPIAVAAGQDGSIYIADTNFEDRIRRVGPDGIITTVAGNGTEGFAGDGGPATQASLFYPQGIAVGQDGSLYIADSVNYRIRKVGTDGIITTVAGNGTGRFGGDGGPAIKAGLGEPRAVAVGADGSIYIADDDFHRIRKVGPDGIITTVAGNGTEGFAGDGGPATQASLSSQITSVAVGQDGSIYIADRFNRIRMVGPDGIINTLAGNGVPGYGGDGGPATQASLNRPFGVAVGQDHNIYITDTGNSRLRNVSLVLSGYYSSDLMISSEDGSEIYVFTNSGRHLRTLDSLTGAILYEFGYDSAGRLINVTDVNGNILTIERDSNDNAKSIVSPYGQRTDLTTDTNGYLTSITNPAGETNQFNYTSDGLLTKMTDPRGSVSNYSYDSLGRLIKDEDPVGGFKTLSRKEFANGYYVTLATGMNRNTTYQVEQLPTGDQRLVNTFPSGIQFTNDIGMNGIQTLTLPNDQSVLTQGPDPRFGMQSPVANNVTITTQSGLTQTITRVRKATLTNQNDPLSLQILNENLGVNGLNYNIIFDSTTKNITLKTPLGRNLSVTLDDRDHIIETDIPGNIPAKIAYNIRGHVSSITQGIRNYSFNYNAQENLVNFTNLAQTVSYEYDNAGRVVDMTTPEGHRINYSYDSEGNIISITPPGRPSHFFNYTKVNLLEDYIPPDVGIGNTKTHYTYNIDGDVTNETRPDGATIDFAYDNAGRLGTIRQSTRIINVAYDTNGNIKSIGTNGSLVNYTYDGELLTDTSWSGIISGNIHLVYDNNFSAISESINGGNTVNFQYDLDGDMTNAGIINLNRDPHTGILIGTTIRNITDAFGYNDFGEVTSYQAASNNANMLAVNYTRDNIGRIIQKNETIDNSTHIYTYQYDLAERITNVSKDGNLVSQYIYDANDNRLSYTSASGTLTGTYDNQDRLIQYGTTTYNYTANGGLHAKINGSNNTLYQYDDLDNLMNVTLSDGTHIDYLTDGLNHRIGKKVNGILIQGFLYKDQPNPIVELDGANNVVSHFVYASQSDVPDYMIKSGNTYRIITDNIGSPRIVTDVATGLVVQRMDYDEYGNVLVDTNPGFQPFGFAGGLYDRDTKLVHLGSREYDTYSGRWTTKDPILFDGGDTNLYEYVYNNPIELKDHYGFGATITCKNGKYVVLLNDLANKAFTVCIYQHENSHIADWKQRYGANSCKGNRWMTHFPAEKGFPASDIPAGDPGYVEFDRKSECKATKIEKTCEETLLKICPSEQDKKEIQEALDNAIANLKFRYHCKP